MRKTLAETRLVLNSCRDFLNYLADGERNTASSGDLLKNMPLNINDNPENIIPCVELLTKTVKSRESADGVFGLMGIFAAMADFLDEFDTQGGYNFKIQARNSDGIAQSRKIKAPSEEVAMSWAKAMGYSSVKIEKIIY